MRRPDRRKLGRVHEQDVLRRWVRLQLQAHALAHCPMADLAELLRKHTQTDVGDLLEVCSALEDKEDLTTYLQAFIDDAAAVEAVAARIVAERGNQQPADQPSGAAAAAAAPPEPPPTGAKVYRKQDDVEEYFAGKPGKAKAKGAAAPAQAAPAKAAVVGGASAVAPRKSKKAMSAKGIEGLGRALREGRHPCDCNARRHELLCNCLSCGKVICAQEGEGPCLFCGNDPDVPNGLRLGDASEAEQRKERLLEFDRSSAKRTTVIDDQADYFLHGSNDVWMSQDEQHAAAEAQKARFLKDRKYGKPKRSVQWRAAVGPRAF